MNTVQLAVSYIKREIPLFILQEVFQPRLYDPARTEYYRDNAVGHTLDRQLEDLIVRGWVGVDVNLTSGVTDHLELSGAQMRMIDPWNKLYTFSDESTMGRTIISVSHVSLAQGSVDSRYVDKSACANSELMASARGVLSSRTTMPIISTARVSLVERNVVLLSDIVQDSRYMWLWCKLSHDNDFSDIKPSYRIHFAKMCVLAAKAYIYRELPILIEEGVIRYGASIGRAREYVDGYSDASEMYMEYLEEKWKKIGSLTDDVANKRYLSLIAGGWHA